MKIKEAFIKKEILKYTKLKNDKIKLADHLDSLEYLKLFFFLEKKLKIKFLAKDFNSKNISTVDGLINVIKKKI